MKMLIAVGTRPNFVKAASLYYQLSKFSKIKSKLVHTGQHYDNNLSNNILNELQIPSPDYNLDVGSGIRESQIEMIYSRFTPILLKEKPDVVIVVGDVNSTYACAKCAHDHNFKIAHIEAGLRSFFMEMPEEVNRIETDKIADFLFVTESSGIVNLVREGIDKKKIFFVGNTMIDTLKKNLSKIIKTKYFEKLKLKQKEYALVTLHRQVNVDKSDDIRRSLDVLYNIQKKIKIVFPIHPRTLQSIYQNGLKNYLDKMKNVIVTEPLGYFEFLNMELNAKFLMTDSGGVQEESTYFNVPCITLRENTERPITVLLGTSVLCGTNLVEIMDNVDKIMLGKFKTLKSIPVYWDGNTANRILTILSEKII